MPLPNDVPLSYEELERHIRRMLPLDSSYRHGNIYRLSRTGASAVFAGHFHAGQVQIPILGPIFVPSLYGWRFDHGHFVVNKTHLFVTAGLGADMPPFRIFCQPDAFLVRFRGSSNACT